MYLHEQHRLFNTEQSFVVVNRGGGGQRGRVLNTCWYEGTHHRSGTLEPEDRYGDDQGLFTLTRTMCDRERRTWGCTRTVPGPLAGQRRVIVRYRSVRCDGPPGAGSTVRGPSEPFGTVAHARLLATSNSNTRGG